MGQKTLLELFTPEEVKKYNIRLVNDLAHSKAIHEDALCHSIRAGHARYMGGGMVKVVFDTGKSVLIGPGIREDLN